MRLQDPATAAEGRMRLAQTCTEGYAEGCTNLARAFDKGIGGPVDAARASKLLGHACAMNEVRACAELGGRAMAGVGDQPDPKSGLQAWLRACDLGHAPSCEQAATVVERGLPNLDPDPAGAADLRVRATELERSQSGG